MNPRDFNCSSFAITEATSHHSSTICALLRVTRRYLSHGRARHLIALLARVIAVNGSIRRGRRQIGKNRAPRCAKKKKKANRDNEIADRVMSLSAALVDSRLSHEAENGWKVKFAISVESLTSRWMDASRGLMRLPETGEGREGERMYKKNKRMDRTEGWKLPPVYS